MTRGKIIGVANQQVDIHSFPEKDQNEAHYSPSTMTKLEFKLTQRLLSEVKANKSNKDANSGKQACKDLPRMSFIINNKPIGKSFVKQLTDEPKQNDKRQIAKHVFIKMFEHAGAEVPNGHILEELITHCNQAGYEFAIYRQIHPILIHYNLVMTIPKKTISIDCNSADSASVKYSDVIIIKNPDPDQFKQYESASKLEFTLKFQSDRVDYENGKVTLTIPEQLSSYKANSKGLIDDINQNFKDADNTVVESLIANIGDGPKSFIADQEDLNNDEESSLVIIPENPTLDLESVVESVKGAINAKNVDSLINCVDVVQDNVISVSPQKGLKVVEKILEMVGNFTKEQGRAWDAYPGMPVIKTIYSASQCYYNGYISQEDYEKVKSLEDILCKIQSDLIERMNNNYNKGSPIINVEDVSLTITNQSVSDEKSALTEKAKSDTIVGTGRFQQETISDSYKEVKMPNSGQFIKVLCENNENESPNIMKPVAKQPTQVTSRAMISRLCKENSNPSLRSEKLNKVSSLRNPNIKRSLIQRRFSVSTYTTSNVGKNSHRLKPKSNNLQQSLNEKTNEPMSIKAQLTEKEQNNANQRVSQLEHEHNVTKHKLEELQNVKIKQLVVVKSKNNDLKTQVQKSESTNEQLENQIKNLEKQLKSKNKDIEGKKEKNLTVSARKIKDKISYASAFFILSGVCAVGASLTIPYLAICITLAIVAFIFLATGCYCSYKANTALSNIEVDQVLKDPECVVPQNSV
ncbi:TomO hydrophobic C-terminal domain-containing protein [Wolbachia endosymbiont (group A) of Bombylius major]|uniref:TomO hydrophobic C-terminal domain-containing protein n=1 Tax=Wolbachia endosymbiont (group A) of Bombylius major TaxID=2953988 RepID=UPI002232197C|nr:hypothetical protein [Wolbachia endosymbiont (group A) of Bombylius major]